VTVVDSRAGVGQHDGEEVIVEGRYRAIARPRKGPEDPTAPRELAVIALSDGLWVYIEPLDSPRAARPRLERERFDGVLVRVTGVLHEIMPSRGQGLLAPCLSDVTRIAER
jgi:hypothetical protein